MPLLHCNKCHYEWEGGITSKCAWCGNEGHVLEEKTPLERFLDKGINFIMNTKLGGE